MPVGLREEGVSGATGYSSQQELEEWTLNYHQLEHIYIFGQFLAKLLSEIGPKSWHIRVEHIGASGGRLPRPGKFSLTDTKALVCNCIHSHFLKHCRLREKRKVYPNLKVGAFICI